MIKFDVPPFISIRTPKYSFDSGAYIPALKIFPPFLRSELYELISQDSSSRKIADTFNRFIAITFITLILAAIASGLSILSYRFFYYKGLFYPSFMLLLICLISNFMAWYNFSLMANKFEIYFNIKSSGKDSLRHFEINDYGIFAKDNRKAEIESSKGLKGSD